MENKAKLSNLGITIDEFGNNVIIGGNVFIYSSIEDNKMVVFEKENYKIKDRKGG